MPNNLHAEVFAKTKIAPEGTCDTCLDGKYDFFGTPAGKSCPNCANGRIYTLEQVLERMLPRTHQGVGLCLWAAGAEGWKAEYDGHERIARSALTPLQAALSLCLALPSNLLTVEGKDEA